MPGGLHKRAGNQTADELLAWADALDSGGGRDAGVLVGAPTRARAHGTRGLGLPAAYDLLRGRVAPPCLGGVAIAERHVRRFDEDERLLRKHAAGCRFFISQTVFDASATTSLLSDYAL